MDHLTAYPLLCEKAASWRERPASDVRRLLDCRVSERVTGSDGFEYLLDSWCEEYCKAESLLRIRVSIVSPRDQQLDRLEESVEVHV